MIINIPLCQWQETDVAKFRSFFFFLNCGENLPKIKRKIDSIKQTKVEDLRGCLIGTRVRYAALLFPLISTKVPPPILLLRNAYKT